MKRFIGIFLLLVVVAGVVASDVVSSTATSEEKMDYAKFELESLMNILDINGTIYNGQTDVYQNVISEDFFHHTVHKVGASNPLFKGVDVLSVQVLNDDVDLVLHPEYFYSVVLMDILQNGELQAFNEDALQSTVTSNTTKTVEKTYSAIAENWSDSLGSNSLTNFMNADLSKLTDLQIEQLGNDLIETNRKSFGYTNTVSNLNLLSYFVDVGEVLIDAIEKINTLQAVAFYNAKTIEILDDIYYNTSNSNLKKAIRDIKNIYEDIDSPEELQNKLSEANVTATMYTVQRLTYVTAKFVVTTLATGVLKVGLIVWDIGFSLANAVFSLSDKSTCYMTIDAAVLIENELRACMSRYRSDYLSNRTVENAERCRGAYRLTLANQYYATNLVQKLGYIIAGNGSLSGSFSSLFGNDDYQVFVDNCENTRSIIWSRYYSFTEVTQRFYESLYGGDFEHSTSTPIILVSSVYFEHSSYTLLANETIQNKATAYPKNASGRSISYSSSNPSVATVNSIGEITAVSEGKAIITATSTNDISTTCEITVLPFKASIVNGTYQIDKYVGNGGAVAIPGEIRGVSVTKIGNDVFYNCDSLTYIIIPNSVTTIGESAFFDCDSLTSVIIPDRVTAIDRDAFYSCGALTSVTIGNSVKYIDYAAFGYCYGLQNVYYTGNIAGWCGICFSDFLSNPIFYAGNLYVNGKLVKDIIIPDTVTNIQQYAFFWCTSLTSVTIPNSVKTIGDYAFYDCTGITSVTIPNSVTIIGNRAFYECVGLSSIIIGNGVTSIGSAAFYRCTGLKSVTIPNSVTSIGSDAFYGCTGLTNVIIPDSVTSIGMYAFSYCTSLTNVTIGNSVTRIGEYAFDYCDSLTSIVVSADNQYYSSDSYGVLYNKSKTKLVKYPNDNKRISFTIPDSVTSIEKNAFDSCTNLTGITIPNSVTAIGVGAFYDCSNLASITIPDNVTSIGDVAFVNCINLKNVIVGNSVSTIGFSAFNGCINLTSVTISDSVAVIGDYAFMDCKSLIDVCFRGTQSQWSNISIGKDNENLISVVHFIHSHSFDWMVNSYPTSTQSGFKTGLCSVCNGCKFCDGVCEVELPVLEFSNGNVANIDFDSNTISGFDAGATSIDDYVSVETDGYSFTCGSAVIGTGAVIELTDGDTVITEFTAVVFGDVNGDGWYDGTDSIIVSCLANGMLTQDSVSEAVYRAADCNHDGVIDSFDIAILEQAGLLLSGVDQSKSNEELATDEAFIEYLDLIDQTPEDETVEDEVIEAPEVEAEEEFDFIEFIITIIKKFFELLFSTLPIK